MKGVLSRPNLACAAHILDGIREITAFATPGSFPNNRVRSWGAIKVPDVKLFLIAKLITSIFVAKKKMDLMR